MPDDKTCFVISPIGEDGSDERARADQILKYIVRPVAEGCGYDVVRADEMSEPGMITSQVIQHIVDDEMVVADLTDWNPNVFYELALRHALRMPAVHLIQAGQKIPFDVAGARTIQVDHTNLPSVEACKEELEKQIQAVEGNPNLVDNPISVAVELQSLRQSDNPLEKSNARILSAVQELRSLVMEILAGAPSPPLLKEAVTDALLAVIKAREELDLVAAEVGGETLAIRVNEVDKILSNEALAALTYLDRRLRTPIPWQTRGLSDRNVQIAESFLENESTSAE